MIHVNNKRIASPAHAAESQPRPFKIEVVVTNERDETPEEVQKRIAQAEEDKKKTGKKPPAGSFPPSFSRKRKSGRARGAQNQRSRNRQLDP